MRNKRNRREINRGWLIRIYLLKKLWISWEHRLQQGHCWYPCQSQSDALGINIYIYQKETDRASQRDYILRIRSMCSNSSKQVHLKFTHNNVHSQGNHYDPIVHDDSTKTNLDILASVAEYATKMPTNDVACIDSDDEDIIVKWQLAMNHFA